MSSYPSTCKEDIRSKALMLGAAACGFAKAEVVDTGICDIYSKWIDDGCNGEMAYCRRYTDIRFDPRMLHEGASTVISIAFNYYNDTCPSPLAKRISRYAWGDDYHYVVKDKLNVLSRYITDTYGGSCRVAVDSAPVMERYWAVRSGIGFTGKNGQLIVPGAGSYCFLGEVVWTESLEPDAPCVAYCDGCMACVKACPGHALDGSGRCDARKCVSYLTIEHKSELPEHANLGGSIYGCDICQKVCPHNRGIAPTALPELKPVNPLLDCTEQDILDMTSSHYRRLTCHSAMQRVPLHRLCRNLNHK